MHFSNPFRLATFGSFNELLNLPMNNTDTLIVGQGIAGSLVAHLLHQRNVPFIVLDPGHDNTASRIAAGMFTPVTGKRKTVHPLVQQQLELALHTYRSIGQLLGIDILHEKNIYHVFQSVEEQQQFAGRAKDVSFKKFIIPEPERLSQLKDAAGACEITHSGWVDCEAWLNGYAYWLNERAALKKAAFKYEDLHIDEAFMQYEDIICKRIIFCEGYQAIQNPFFQQEQIIPCKGNVLTVQCDAIATGHMLKKNGVYLVPCGKKYKAGATYQWNNATSEPDTESANVLKAKLDDLLIDRYRILDHKAAIRPTTPNREVIATQHPQYKGMFMLNGLGTKGILQGPWWAKHLVEELFRRS